MKAKKNILFFSLFQIAIGICASAVILSSCGNDKKKVEITKEQEKEIKKHLVEVNKINAEKESAEIDAYAQEKGWHMITTGTGLRYEILKNGKGENAKLGQIAKVNYKIFLTDGTLCYSSDKDGAKEFKVGEDYVESGLHEGIQLMNTGCKARFILPSHLAHGLTGDNDKIPPMSTVVYEVELLSLHDPK